MIRRAALGTTLVVITAQPGAPSAAQQRPTYTERVEVSRVLIDARVVDAAGNAIPGLGPDDFVVKIDGKPARVETVQWIEREWSLEDERQPLDAASIDIAEAPRQGRLIVFIFQKSMEPSRIVGFMRMLIETREFVDLFTPRDRVAVLSFDSSLRIWLDFTSNLERVKRVVQQGILFGRPTAIQESPFPSLLARLTPAIARRTYSIEDALLLVGEALEPLPGAKSVVLVGHGFGRLGPMGVMMENNYGEASAALQRARASVFCLDVTQADYHSLEAGLRTVAADTGGFFVRTHIFSSAAMKRLAGVLAGEYVLFVVAPDTKKGIHRVAVELKGRKGTVLARNAYIND
jgi:VWFA-related protein